MCGTLPPISHNLHGTMLKHRGYLYLLSLPIVLTCHKQAKPYDFKIKTMQKCQLQWPCDLEHAWRNTWVSCSNPTYDTVVCMPFSSFPIIPLTAITSHPSPLTAWNMWRQMSGLRKFRGENELKANTPTNNWGKCKGKVVPVLLFNWVPCHEGALGE